MTARNRTPAADPLTAGLPSDALTGTTHVDPLNVDTKHLDKKVKAGADMSLDELRDSLNATVSFDMNDPHFQKFAADAKFMEEEILVRVHPSTDPNAEKVVDVYNNGTPQRFIRGMWVKARRKYVEVLARAKPFNVSTPEYTDGNGDRATRIDTTAGMRYPFETRDPNPNGAPWLNAIMQEA